MEVEAQDQAASDKVGGKTASNGLGFRLGLGSDTPLHVLDPPDIVSSKRRLAEMGLFEVAK